MSQFTVSNTIASVHRVFDGYFNIIGQQEARQAELKSQHAAREKVFYKLISKIEKAFKRGIDGKFKVDILNELSSFVNEETTHRHYLVAYGRGLLTLRHTLVS